MIIVTRAQAALPRPRGLTMGAHRGSTTSRPALINHTIIWILGVANKPPKWPVQSTGLFEAKSSARLHVERGATIRVV